MPNINKAFEPKLSNCISQAKFLASPLVRIIFYEITYNSHLRQYFMSSFSTNFLSPQKKLQSQTVSREKLVVKCWRNWHLKPISTTSYKQLFQEHIPKAQKDTDDLSRERSLT